MKIAVVGLGTALSRITGFLRVSAMAAIGFGQLTDVYNVANSTPNIVYELLLGGILTATLVPLFVEHLHHDDEHAADAIQQRHGRLQGENAQSREPVGRGEREQFRNQIAEQNNDRENDRRRDPGRNARGQRAVPNQKQAQNNDGDVRENVAKQKDVENATRVLSKHADEFLQRWMFFLEAAKLMRLEGEERGLQTRKERRPEDEDRDKKKEDG